MRQIVILIVLFSLLPVAFAADDVYEPDDSYLNSTNIPVNGTWQTHNFSSSDDDDWLNFNASAGEYYLIQTRNLSAPGLTDIRLFLYDTDGSTKLSADEAGTVDGYHSARIVWRAIGSGTYYLLLNESGNDVGGSYNISVEQQGKLVPYLVSPSSWMNATKHSTFNFTAGVTCVGEGPCRNVQAILDPEPQKLAKAHGDVVAQIGNDGVARVMVKLKDDSSTLTGKGFERKQDRVLGNVRMAQGVRVGASSGEDFRLRHRFRNMNAFAGTVTAKGLERLAADPDVDYVYPDRRVEAALDVSVPLIDAKYDTWNIQVGGENITGTDQTICVIDTGINYSHPDFGGYASFPNAKVLDGYCYCDDYVPDDSTGCCTDGDEESSSGFLDDHSHGSHCAGIAASEDSTYTGVAPGASLVAVKALDSTGSGWMSDVAAGVDWCVSNAAAYNISVISMSIGTWYVYDNNGFGCEDFDPVMTEAVNNAVADDIFVAIAAGNRWTSGDKGIASPGCIRNATSVGITDDGDGIVSWGQRGFTLDLMAPGNSILATDYDGTHMTKSGTSMSTPHVAGAAAIIQQYFRLKHGRTLTPQQVEWLLGFNGVDLYDATTDYTYPRIDVYSAVTSKGAVSTTVGATPFYTTTANPHDSSCLDVMQDGSSCNVSWMVNATGDFGNYTFFTIFETDYMSNITDKLNITIMNDVPVLSSASLSPVDGNTTTMFNYTVNYSDADNHTAEFMYVVINSSNYSMLPADAGDTDVVDGKVYYYQTTLVEGNYTYYFNASDPFNMTSTSLVYAPNVSDNLAPSLNLSGPADNANVSSSLQVFVFNVSDESATTVNCSLIFDGSMVNYSVFSNFGENNLSYSIPSQGTYLWNISCSDGQNTNVSAVMIMTYDSAAPSVCLSSPSNRTALMTNSSDFVFNASDNLFSTLACTLYAGGSASASNSSVADSTVTTFSSVQLAAGSLSWYVNCTDPASNSGLSLSRTIIVPQQNATTGVNTTANATFNINATAGVDINLSTVQNTTGSVAVAQYNTNPENVEASSANGFAALGLGTFVAVNASAEVEGNLSWYILSIYYSDASLPSNIVESSLRIYYFNTSSGEWEQEPDSGVDTDANRVWANVSHFSVFSAGGSQESGGSGGGGGGGGGGASASSEPIGVVPTYTSTIVEAPKSQEISVSYDGASYLFKVDSFTGSVLELDSLYDGVQSHTLANGLTKNFDLDSDGRDDIQIVYSGSYDNQALLVFYLVQKPEPIPLLPPAKPEPREELEPVAEVEEPVGQAAPPELAVVQEVEPEPAPETSFFAKNKRLLMYLGAVVGLIVVVFLVMQVFTGRKGKSAGSQEKGAEKD